MLQAAATCLDAAIVGKDVTRVRRAVAALGSVRIPVVADDVADDAADDDDANADAGAALQALAKALFLFPRDEGVVLLGLRALSSVAGSVRLRRGALALMDMLDGRVWDQLAIGTCRAMAEFADCAAVLGAALICLDIFNESSPVLMRIQVQEGCVGLTAQALVRHLDDSRVLVGAVMCALGWANVATCQDLACIVPPLVRAAQRRPVVDKKFPFQSTVVRVLGILSTAMVHPADVVLLMDALPWLGTMVAGPGNRDLAMRAMTCVYNMVNVLFSRDGCPQRDDLLVAMAHHVALPLRRCLWIFVNDLLMVMSIMACADQLFRAGVRRGAVPPCLWDLFAVVVATANVVLCAGDTYLDMEGHVCRSPDTCTCDLDVTFIALSCLCRAALPGDRDACPEWQAQLAMAPDAARAAVGRYPHVPNLASMARHLCRLLVVHRNLFAAKTVLHGLTLDHASAEGGVDGADPFAVCGHGVGAGPRGLGDRALDAGAGHGCGQSGVPAGGAPAAVASH